MAELKTTADGAEAEGRSRGGEAGQSLNGERGRSLGGEEKRPVGEKGRSVGEEEGRSFVSALYRKFEEDEQPLQFAILIAKSAPRKTESGELVLPERLSLSDSRINRAGDMTGVRRSLSHVTELDLSVNRLNQWSEVFQIISHLPKLHFLNLSNNPLHLSDPLPSDFKSPDAIPSTDLQPHSQPVTASPEIRQSDDKICDISAEVPETNSVPDRMSHNRPNETIDLVCGEKRDRVNEIESSETLADFSGSCDHVASESRADFPGSCDHMASGSRDHESCCGTPWDEGQSEKSAESSQSNALRVLDVITQLVLNSTKLSWTAITNLLSCMPRLRELHLSFNDYSVVDVTPNLSFPSVADLHFNGNRVSSWSELERLGRLFPGLTNFVVMDNPLVDLSALSCGFGVGSGASGALHEDNRESGGGVCSGATVNESTGTRVDSWASSEMVSESDEDANLDKFDEESGEVVMESVPAGFKTEESTERESEKIGSRLGKSGELDSRADCSGTERSEEVGLGADGSATGTTGSMAERSGEVGSGVEGSEFKALRSLCLMRTQVGSWEELEKLRRLPSLTEVKVIGIPFLQKIEEKLRRLLLIGYLPNIQRLNGSAVSDTEREDAERAFIRHYMDREDKPARYAELEKIHGKLLPLVNLDLGATTLVSFTVRFGDHSAVKRVSLHTTAQELKRALAREFVHRPASQFLMYHNSAGDWGGGSEKMGHPNRTLLNYRVMDGDEIVCELK